MAFDDGASGKPRLLVRSSDGDESVYYLRAINTIGRHSDQNVQLLDRVVSKNHALITYSDGHFYLQDMGSRNGTYVNQRRLQGRTRLYDGDLISMGGSRLLFVDDQESPRSSLPQVCIQENLEGQATSICSRCSFPPQDSHFLPESEITDEEVLRSDYEKLRISFRLNQAIGAEWDFDRMTARILETALEVTNAERGVILLLDESGKPEPCAVLSRTPGESVAVSQTILNEVIATKHGLLSRDATMDSRFSASHSIICQNIRSIACVPLMFGDSFLGVIHLDSRIATGIFTEKDLQMLTVFAQQAALKLANARLVRKAEQETLARNNLSRLLSPNLVEMVVRGDLDLEERRGIARDATVLFCDIRGFTAMCESVAPAEIVSMLNEYFEILVDIVFQHDGTLDKFIGDALMAVWGSPVPQADHTERAIRAALEMSKALVDLNRFRVVNGEQPLNVGIGINSGTVIAGYMGSTKALSYTVVGDTVNTASRLCSYAQAGEILVSDPIVQKLGSRLIYEERPKALLKGKAHPCGIFAVRGLKEGE